MSPHVAYGGAQLLSKATPEKWRSLALSAFETYVPEPAVLERFGVALDLQATVHARALARLQSKDALGSLRIDFEDGYGVRPDDEEDAAAEAAAGAVNEMPRRPELGIRPKSLGPATRARALRTLGRFFGALDPGIQLVVTLPKVQSTHDVAIAVGALSLLESRYGHAPVGLELMAETPAFFDTLEREGLAPLQRAAEGRLRSIHFGAYDMLSALGVAGHEQALDHPYCTPLRLALAKAAMPLAVPLYDGATLTMPAPVHRGAALDATQLEENRAAVLGAMAGHARSCEQALALGFAGSWDLHPAQLVPRYVATAAFYLRALRGAGRRLAAFLTNAARATRAGQSFDDAASARGLLAFVAAGLESGLVAPEDLPELPVAAEQLRTLPFDALVSTVLASPAANAQLPR